jgi:prolipoprotein diacylglyceryltransferase
MRRVLFSVRGVPIWSYPALLYLGLVCGFYVMYAVGPSLGMHRTPAAVAALIMFAPAVAGARIWFVLDHWAIYRRDPRRIWRYSDGGMTLYGGLVLALVLSPVVVAALRLPFAAFGTARRSRFSSG